MNFISVFVKYRALISQLVMRDIKTKYRRSVLGLVWTVLNPLLMMTVLSIVFSYFFSIGNAGFQSGNNSFLYIYVYLQLHL